MKKSTFSIARKISITAACLLIANFSFSQKAVNAWSQVKESAIKQNKSNRFIVPSKYRVMSLNVSELKNSLRYAKLEADGNKSADIVIALPNPEGGFTNYKVYKNTTMHADLAANFPEIRSYNAVSLDNNKETVKLDITPHGFHAMILSPERGTIFIDPYAKGDLNNYQIYYRNDYNTDRGLTCSFSEEVENIKPTNFDKSFGTCELRTYRLAVACTGEYASAVGGGVNGALAAQVTTMNRVNGVYERDMAITLTIIPNNNLLIYTNAATDPYSNNNAGILIGENQSNINNIIGSGNYDIGHVFSTGGGGLAGFGVVCSNSSKARGVTGRANPQGDPFDIDYVAHEMGHQFGGSHSFNNSCSGNRSASTAYEPGSGSSIMGYAGICSPNVKNNSDAVFHGISLEQIGNYITGNGNSCPVKTPLSNAAPSITATNLDGNVTIPANTPFALSTTATDADGDALTYNWHQMDREITTQPPLGTATSGPNFRSFEPSADSTQYFPRLILINNNGPFTWEVLPTVSRTMNFRAVVRDNSSGGGCNDHKDVSVDVDGGSGPFLVTAPNVPFGWWTVGQPAQVTWDVAGTDLAPVNCSHVDILLSTDNGASYPITIASNVPNQGQWSFITPNHVTTTARVMVISSNGTFFDVSNVPHKIQTSTGINDINSEQSIVSYFNNDKIELSLTKIVKGDYNVSVVNTLGQVVSNKTITVNSDKQKVTLPFTNTTNGIYYITLSNKKDIYNTKFYKN